MPVPKILFVAYGGAHIQMVLPVARALGESGLAQPVILGLTTAAAAVREAGLPLLQFKDFLAPADHEARRWGEQLLGQTANAAIEREESIAYLGLSFAELVAQHGEAGALREYAEKGRHSFLPVGVLRRVLQEVQPELLVSTASPRAEQAAFLAARELGIPSLCLIDSFIERDAAARFAAPGYADAICVLNEHVKKVLVECGAAPEAVHCTGNPAFDVLRQPASRSAGRALREKMGWGGKRVVLYPVQEFPAYHPVAGAWGGTDLPGQLRAALLAWAAPQEDVVVCIRPRPGDASHRLEDQPRLQLTGGPDWPLPPLLNAVDLVVTVNSTVGIEGGLAGARVIRVLGTPWDAETPWERFGLADGAVDLPRLAPALDAVSRLPRRDATGDAPLATAAVLGVVRDMLRAQRAGGQ
ncbi:hypothetical protein HHL11_24275 [Ramlibacter sp. G-1-2-2]|uniref:UDP-glycosyltransferase n=1 Tax=Ramlibacter agri TaxID=2728837 RepID=A0A848H8Q3_9BURK|nr:hypothetical protein [Ramlibacter agri]NML46884.1 hypothetical protein [Ramlibacter agri]